VAAEVFICELRNTLIRFGNPAIGLFWLLDTLAAGANEWSHTESNHELGDL
jgi:hypothetical protein